MQEIVAVFFSALAVLFMARKVARRVGLVDKPNSRKLHQGHIPLVGGVSVYLSLWILYLMQPAWLPDFTLYMVCATLLLAIGVLDDRYDLPVWPRVALQAAIAVLMICNGLYLKSFGEIFFGHELFLGIGGTVITVLAIWGAINAFNMVDGVDGLLGALSCVTFCALTVVFYIHGNTDMALWCLCLMVSCLPYLLLNLGVIWGRKFKVFMGDAGSTLIGFTVIWVLILGSQGENRAMEPVTALWLIAIPLMDMVRVMISRIRCGNNPFKPDRQHLHHILMRAGSSARGTVMIMAFLATLLATVGIVGEMLHVPAVISLLFFICVFIFYCLTITLLAQARAGGVYLK
jgi:UDP-GlcNAc:undecaprenyl-phosphate GlcNAc-1-phosphate transferase